MKVKCSKKFDHWLLYSNPKPSSILISLAPQKFSHPGNFPEPTEEFLPHFCALVPFGNLWKPKDLLKIMCYEIMCGERMHDYKVSQLYGNTLLSTQLSEVQGHYLRTSDQGITLSGWCKFFLIGNFMQRSFKNPTMHSRESCSGSVSEEKNELHREDWPWISTQTQHYLCCGFKIPSNYSGFFFGSSPVHTVYSVHWRQAKKGSIGEGKTGASLPGPNSLTSSLPLTSSVSLGKSLSSELKVPVYKMRRLSLPSLGLLKTLNY